ncbi:MAG: hypothetical protein GX806_02515 [Lentisphaerae bacterium]|nr:hypothetical protein [Lentisphaerota bacterium]
MSNVTLTNTLKQAGSTDIKFDLSWENSWRASWTEDDTGAGHAPQTVTNWDAAWVFIKYRLREGANTNWQHVYLASEGHVAPEGITITPGASDDVNVGAFIHRSVNGFGPLNLADLRLRWDYKSQNLQPSAPLDVSVQAIEMVYIPAGPFYVGDGRNYGDWQDRGAFEDGASGLPFRVTNEFYEITLGGGEAGSLGNHGCQSMNRADDFNSTNPATVKILPAAYPKGFDAFYCMKYMGTQEQYKNFLNKLTRNQQTNLVHAAGTNASYFALSGTASISGRNGIRCPAEAGEGPIVFGCDFNGNGTFNEVGDGQDLPCGFLNSQRVSAYLEWAGLRPMTALEYEKTCRGPKYPVLIEYAWGTASSAYVALRAWPYLADDIDGSGTETLLNPQENLMANRWNQDWLQPPVRVGIFAARQNASRVQAGAGYYGVMELSGNLEEGMIALGLQPGRAFTGAHGDGVLTANGLANVINWPSSREGWQPTYWEKISNRYQANVGDSPAIRGVRTAP